MRALYGSKKAIKEVIERDRARKWRDRVIDKGIADVTIGVRFAMVDSSVTLEKMRTKRDLMGFFNPIAPIKNEAPVLCVIYVKNPSDRVNFLGDVMHVDYFKDS